MNAPIEPSAKQPLSLPSDQNSSGRTLGDAEIAAVTEALRSGTLTSTKGTFTKQFEQKFAELLGSDAAYANSSGTAALHTAIAAIDPEPGDEIITTSITDMGALTPIMYQGAIPVFADVDPMTYNVTAESIERCISEKTRAIMVTHLFGNPCDMGPIMQLAASHNIPVIEDVAQAFLAKIDDQYMGTIGDIGCFSLQQGKHITTGEGGVVISNNADYARRSFLYINKAWGYGDAKPDHYFLALNYRMNDLTGAVALAQLEKLQDSVDRRVTLANEMRSLIEGIPGVTATPVKDNHVHTYWKFCLDVDPSVIKGGTDALGAALKEYGVFSAPRYIQKPAFRCQVIRDQRTFGDSRFPFNLARPAAIDYSEELFPGTFQALSRVLVLPWNEKYTSEDVAAIAGVLHKCARDLS